MLWLTLFLFCAALGSPVFINSTEEETDEDPFMYGFPHIQNEINTNETDLQEYNMNLTSISESLNRLNVSDTSYQAMHHNNRESQEALKVERDKLQRLQTVQTQILGYLGLLDRQPAVNTTLPKGQQEIIQDLIKFKRMPQIMPAETYTEKIQSFFPSCDIPRKTDEEMWNDANILNLFFNISNPSAGEGAAVNIINAKLRLYRISQEDLTSSSSSVPEPCTRAEDGTVMVNHPEDERQIRVSVYWYMRSLKKNKVKRKLLDSKMLSLDGDEWVEFNIRPAARSWRVSGKNFGLAVEVEDEEGNMLNPTKYFNDMNCSKEASTARPIPSFLYKFAREIDNNGTFDFDSYLFPMIDLCTIELPKGEVPPSVISFTYDTQAPNTITQNSTNPLQEAEDRLDEILESDITGERVDLRNIVDHRNGYHHPLHIRHQKQHPHNHNRGPCEKNNIRKHKHHKEDNTAMQDDTNQRNSGEHEEKEKEEIEEEKDIWSDDSGSHVRQKIIFQTTIDTHDHLSESNGR